MDNFQQNFLNEAHELISRLEENVLLLENQPSNVDVINDIFRTMHSLKGSGAMFGFKALSEFTHHLENLYDSIRSGKIKLSGIILDFTLQSVDHIKRLLDPQPEPDAMLMGEHLLAKLNGFLDTDSIGSNQQPKADPVSQTADSKKTFLVCFEPHTDIMLNGNNPLFLIDELVEVGQCMVHCHSQNLPDFLDLKPKQSYLSWNILLAGETDEKAIRDVFLFVEEESQLQITQLSDQNLFESLDEQTELLGIVSSVMPDTEALIQHYKKYNTKQAVPETSEIGEDPVVQASSLPNETMSEEIVTDQKAHKSESDSHIATVRVSAEKLDTLINLVSELVTSQASLQLFAENENNAELSTISENIQQLSRQFRDISFGMRLIPIESIMVKFRRLVRDLSHSLDKDVAFLTNGTDTELDKNIIENLSDPLMHIIRNSLDHGIENSEERSSLGKTPQGKIEFKAYYSGSHVHILVKDDGHGIDQQVVRAKAIERNIIKEDDQLTEKEVLNLLFNAGFTTKSSASDLSGRGVGMDVVRRKITELNGEIELKSVKGKGTETLIRLPLTLSIIDGFMVKVGDTSLIIPLSSVEKIYELSSEKLEKTYHNIVDIEGEQIQFLHLRKDMNLGGKTDRLSYLITVFYDEHRIGLVVDKVIGECQAVLKPLGKYLLENDIFSGASIMGDGKVALVVDTNKLIKRYIN